MHDCEDANTLSAGVMDGDGTSQCAAGCECKMMVPVALHDRQATLTL